MKNAFKSLFIAAACFAATTVGAADVTFTISDIFDGTNLSVDVTSPVKANVSTNASKSNSKTGKLGSDGNYFQVVFTDDTFTAVSINGFINTNNTSKNWAFQFSTDKGATWSYEQTQANDGTKTAHDITVNATIPANANGFRVVRRAGTATTVNTITFTLAGGSEPTTTSVTGITVQPTTLNMVIGDTKSVSYTIAPANATNQNITWSSSNPSVASVTAGIVQALAAGTATVTVTTEDGGYTATCTVTVTAPATSIPVTGISLDKSTASIYAGQTETLTVTYTPADANTGKAITWSSDNTSVATVNNGVVTGVAPGTAVVTATSEGGFTATCTVTITTANPVPATDLSLHVPEIYEARAIAGGYETPLTLVSGREYEVFYITRDADSKLCFATTNADKTAGITTRNSGDYSCAANDGWFKSSGTGWSSSSDAMGAEFGTMARRLDMDNSSEFTMHVSGYDQFAIVARDKKIDTSSGQTKPADNRYLEVYINGVLQPLQFNTSPSIRRYDIPTSECIVRIVHYGTEKSAMYGFSLRLAQEPRTKWLKGNDSTQVILQTTVPKPVYYFTKYNALGETKLLWEGAEATGITLSTYASTDLGDTLVLGGTANCPVGTYNYRVVSLFNGNETSSVAGSLTVISQITAQTATKTEGYQNEAIDDIRFAYYALSANDITLTWANDKQPDGITGNGSNGTYTLSGTPTETGEFIYTISVAGGNSITDTITVKLLDLGNNPVLYLYKNDLAYNKDGIFHFLTSQDGGKRNLIARKAKLDGLRPADQYANYKWILISEDVDADNPEILALARGEGGLPVLSMKSFSYTPERLNWGEPAYGSLTMDEGRYVTVQRPDHPIFKALGKKQGDRIQVLDTVVGKGLMPIVVNYTGTLCLATARTRSIDSYYEDGHTEETFMHEVPAQMHRNKKYICLPIAAESSNYLSTDGKRLINEAINYILSDEAAIALPSLAITEFKIGNYVGKINDALNTITLDVMAKDSDDMKTAIPAIQLASPMTFATATETADDGTVDFSNWHYGVDYIVSDYINKRTYNVTVRLYDPQGIENIEAGTWVNIFDIYGRKVATTNEDLRSMTLPHGVYLIVTEDGQSIKILK